MPATCAAHAHAGAAQSASMSSIDRRPSNALSVRDIATTRAFARADDDDSRTENAFKTDGTGKSNDPVNDG